MELPAKGQRELVCCLMKEAVMKLVLAENSRPEWWQQHHICGQEAKSVGQITAGTNGTGWAAPAKQDWKALEARQSFSESLLAQGSVWLHEAG